MQTELRDLFQLEHLSLNEVMNVDKRNIPNALFLKRFSDSSSLRGSIMEILVKTFNFIFVGRGFFMHFNQTRLEL